MATAYAIPNIAGYPFNILPDLSNAKVRERLSPSAIRGFVRIMERWGVKELSARKLLGGPSAGTYYGWKAHPHGKKLDQDTLMRISLVVGIYKALHIFTVTSSPMPGSRCRTATPCFAEKHR